MITFWVQEFMTKKNMLPANVHSWVSYQSRVFLMVKLAKFFKVEGWQDKKVLGLILNFATNWQKVFHYLWKTLGASQDAFWWACFELGLRWHRQLTLHMPLRIGGGGITVVSRCIQIIFHFNEHGPPKGITTQSTLLLFWEKKGSWAQLLNHLLSLLVCPPMSFTKSTEPSTHLPAQGWGTEQSVTPRWTLQTLHNQGRDQEDQGRKWDIFAEQVFKCQMSRECASAGPVVGPPCQLHHRAGGLAGVSKC